MYSVSKQINGGLLQVVARLREFASLRAVEIKYSSAAAAAAAASRAAAAATAAASASSADGGVETKEAEAAAAAAAVEAVAAAEARIARGGISGMPCKLQMRIAQVKADLICQNEKQLLAPAGGSGVIRLLRPTIQRIVKAAANSGACSPAADANASAVPATSSAAASASAAAATSLVGVSCLVTSTGTVCMPSPMCFCKLAFIRFKISFFFRFKTLESDATFLYKWFA